MTNEQLASRIMGGEGPIKADWLVDAGKRLREDAKRIANLEAQLEWQPIETSPKDDVFLAYQIYTNPMPCYWTVGGRLASADGKFFDDATHWRPLPKPPQDTQGGE